MNRYHVGLKLIIDGIEQTLIEDNSNRGLFQVTDHKFDSWSIKPTTVYKYEDLNDYEEVK